MQLSRVKWWARGFPASSAEADSASDTSKHTQMEPGIRFQGAPSLEKEMMMNSEMNPRYFFFCVELKAWKIHLCLFVCF